MERLAGQFYVASDQTDVKSAILSERVDNSVLGNAFGKLADLILLSKRRTRLIEKRVLVSKRSNR